MRMKKQCMVHENENEETVHGENGETVGMYDTVQTVKQ